VNHSDEFKKLCDDYRLQIQEIDKPTLLQWLNENKPLHLIDVREADEFAAGYIEDAVHISKGWIEARVHNEVPAKDDVVVLYCGGGNRSVLAAYNLQQMGYSNVYSLAGGYRNWIA
jgi:rhodanese-related sulfurtransferase